MNLQKTIFDYIKILWEDFFEKKTFKKGETIFSNEEDNNFYIIESWMTSILKNVWDTKKEVAKVSKWWFLWEGIFYWKTFKDAEAFCEEDTKILYISLEKLNEIEKKNPKGFFDFYKFVVIKLTNTRLTDTSSELAKIYKLTDIFNRENYIWREGFLKLLENVRWVLEVDYITYIENHPFVDGVFYYKFSTLKDYDIKEKCSDIINKDLTWFIKGWDIMFSDETDSLYVLQLKTSLKLKGLLVFGNQKRSFSESFERILKNLSLSLCSIIEQNQENNWKSLDIDNLI